MWVDLWLPKYFFLDEKETKRFFDCSMRGYRTWGRGRGRGRGRTQLTNCFFFFW